MSAISGKEAKLKEYIENEMKHNKLISDRVSQGKNFPPRLCFCGS